MNKQLIVSIGVIIALVLLVFTTKVRAGEEAPIVYPQEKLTVDFNYIYTPTEGYEIVDGLLPDDIYEMDEFNYNAGLMAKVMYMEARGLGKYGMSQVAWCILNRVDTGKWGNTIEAVVKAPHQFCYKEEAPIDKVAYETAVDVLMRWSMEKYMTGSVGRTLPADYLYFWGDGKLNHFRMTNTDYNYYDDSLGNPYI